MDKKSRRSSYLWNYFTRVDETKAICNLCNRDFSYKSSITNLKKHFNKHSTVNKASKKPFIIRLQNTEISKSLNQPPNVAYIQTISTPSEETPQKIVLPNFSTNSSGNKKSTKTHIDEKLLQLITHDLQPISIVDDEGFKNFCHALNPTYILPSREILSCQMLPLKYEEVRNASKQILKQTDSITLTTDCWTSHNNESYISFTAHFVTNNFETKSVLLDVINCNANHSVQNLSVELGVIVQDWEISEKVLLVVSDNVAIKKVITEEFQWKYIGCMAHTINVVVREALQPVDELVLNVTNILAYFKGSAMAGNDSIDYTISQLKEVLVLISENEMVGEDWPGLSNEEVKEVEGLIQILGPIESVTNIMTSEKQVTLSLVIVITNGLRDLYDNLHQNNTFSIRSKIVLDQIIGGLNKHFNKLESSPTLLISTFLDPRFKNIGFAAESSSEKAQTLVTKALSELMQNKSDSLSTCFLSKADSEETKEFSVWSLLDKRVSTFATATNKNSRAVVEIQRYLDEPLLNRTQNPLDWWRNESFNFPNLSKLAKLKFGTVAMSVPCDSLFPKFGQSISERRSRLTLLDLAEIKQVLFIGHNSSLIDEFVI